MSRIRLFFALAVLGWLVPVAWSDEVAAPSTSPELKRLIEQLDADEFADRTAASERLAKLGKDAIPGLESGVRSDSREAATRCFELLQQLFEKGDEAGKAAAKISLEKIALGTDAVAVQAKKLLQPKPAAPDPNQPQGTIILGGGIRAVPGIRIARLGVGRAVPIAPAIEEGVIRDVKSISVSIANGVKTINVDDNGKKIKIVEDAKKGIEGEITETKDGKETSQKFTAKDADELKTKHPEAFKLYEQYAKGDELKVEATAVGGFGGAPAVPAKLPKERLEELMKRLDDQIASTTKDLEKSKEDKDGRETTIAKRLERYAALRDRYQEQLKELAKQAEAAKPPEIKELKVEIEVKGEK
jgi:hypothetical protein